MNNNNNKYLKSKYNRMGCLFSRNIKKQKCKKTIVDKNISPKKKKRIRKRKKKLKRQKNNDKNKQLNNLDALLNKNNSDITSLLINNNKKTNCSKRKAKIPLAMRQNIWLKHFGKIYEHKCYVSWCTRIISCFDFDVGHNIPECKGGKTDESNLFPICHKCNGGMGSRYTIDEWSNKKFFENYLLDDKYPFNPYQTNILDMD
jgi:hypothetical protein